MARAAREAALAAESSRYAPRYFHKAQTEFREGEKYFKERYFEKARQSFISARKYSERAEVVSRVKQFSTGDMESF